MKKILVIQNNDDDIKDLENILSNDEFEIFYSHKPADGLEISSRYSPNLILIYANNDAGSYDVLSKISGEEKTSSIPTIVVSGKSSFEEQRKVMDLGADDYLPLNLLKESLLNSVKKRLEKLNKLKLNISNQINSFEEENEKPKRDDHILVKIGNKLKLIKFADIVCITSLKEYSKLTTNENCKIVVRKSLKNWIALLPSKSFLQIHRATIINIDYIEKIEKTSERTYTVHLKGISETFDFSHRYANIMRQTFPT